MKPWMPPRNVHGGKLGGVSLNRMRIIQVRRGHNSPPAFAFALAVVNCRWGATPHVSQNEVVTLCARQAAFGAFSQLLFPTNDVLF
jgi:hypothetical protein